MFSDELTITGSLAELQPITIEVVNKTEAEQLWDGFIRQHHYLGFNTMIGQYIKYLVWSEDRPLAALSFNRAALRVGVRDNYIGWNEEGRKKYLKFVVSNHRYLILPWVKVKNLASHILGLCLRRLKGDWCQFYNCEPLLVETFVNSDQYWGTCYLASNWVYVGETKGFGKQGNKFEFHGQKKKVFLCELDKLLTITVTF